MMLVLDYWRTHQVISSGREELTGAAGTGLTSANVLESGDTSMLHAKLTGQGEIEYRRTVADWPLIGKEPPLG